jgi:hypothetical protein
MDQLPPSLLQLTIRFSASLPDLHLPIASPTTTTTAALKRLIRTHLPPDLSTHRIRLIHAGKSLSDTTPLSTSLKLPPPPPPPAASDSQSAIAKGKAPVRDPVIPHIYIHCSIGDVVLSAAELAAEAALASSTDPSGQLSPKDARQTTTTTTPAPRGFDRLLSAGFTPTEIAQLRSQFLAIQAHTHTPDTMPSPNSLRALEDRWIDNDTSATGAAADGGASEDDGRGALQDMVWGAILGFFWPIGCGVWMVREEGVWTWRRKLAVAVGLGMNLVFGCIRFAS